MQLSESRTMANMLAAFAGESQVRNKYEFYAEAARAEGNAVLADIFQKTADNERQHGKVWLKLIKGGALPTTAMNLLEAAQGEHYEHSEMYAGFAETAKAEGFHEFAGKFAAIGEIERRHAERYDSYIQKLQNNTLFSRPTEITWICLKCGYEHSGTTPPEKCPVCDHPTGYFAEKTNE